MMFSLSIHMYTMTVIWEKQRERVETAATCLPALATIFDTLGIRNISFCLNN